MTLQELVNTLKNIALTQPMIQAVSDGDVYDKMNGNPSIRYAVFHVTQTTHTSEDGWDNYGLSLFVIDRLMDDNTNRLEIQSQAKETLINIMRTFCQNFDAECTTLTFTPFTQKFTDNTAGVWCNVTVAVMQDYACPYNYEDGQYFPPITIIDNKDITITQNGVYEVPEGYTGYGQITVALEMQPSKYFEAIENGRYTITPDDGYASMQSVDLDVNIPIEEEREIYVDTNGTYKLKTKKGYAGTKLWNVNVEVYQPNILDNDTISLKAGDKGTYTTPAGYNAVRTLDYEVAPLNILQSDNITVKAGESKTYTAEGYDGVKELNIEATAPNILASDKVEVKAGETVTYEVDDEYDGVKQLDITAQAPNILQSDNITVKSGEIIIYKTPADYDGVKELEITGTSSDIDKMHIPNGITFAKSTIEYFPVDNYNWEWLHDGSSLFSGCSNMKNAGEILEKVKTKELDVWKTEYMFSGVTSIEKVEDIDFNRYTSCRSMFEGCKGLKEIRNCVFPDVNKSNAKNSYYLFTPAASTDTRFKVVDCDFSKVNTYVSNTFVTYMLTDTGNTVHPYFMNFKHPARENQDFIDLATTATTRDIIVVAECDYMSKNSGEVTEYEQNSYVWYDPQYTTWNGPNCHPFYDFYYTFNNNIDKVKSVYRTPMDERIKDERQELTNAGNGRWEAKYPLFRRSNMYIELNDGTTLQPTSLQDWVFNKEVYLPDIGANIKDVYEGRELQNLIYYSLVTNWSITDEGIEYAKTSTGATQTTLNLSSNARSGMIYIDLNYDYNATGKFYITVNGVRVHSLSMDGVQSKSFELPIDFTEDTTKIVFQRDYSKKYNMKITKIEFL